MINCVFSQPVKNDGVPPNLVSQNWEFSKMDCSGSFDTSTSSTSTLPEYLEKQNDNFYLQKTFTLGEIVFLAVLIPAIFVFLLVKIREFLKNKYQ